MAQKLQQSERSSTIKAPKFYYYTASTLNGYIIDENESLDWLFDCIDPISDPISFQQTMGVIVCGSHTLEWIIRNYDLLHNSGQWKEFFHNIPLVVFSSRKLVLPQGANITIINSPVQDAIPLLQDLAGEKDIWIQGGGGIAAQFFEIGALTHIAITYIACTTAGGINVLPQKIPL